MTTIAYKDGVLAADRRVTKGDQIVQYKHRKAYKNVEGWLYAGSGTVSDLKRFEAWAETDDGSKTPPKGDYEGLMVSPEGRVWAVEGGVMWRMTGAKFMAIGSGGPVALGALHAGADAVQAVKIAQLVDSSSGGGVDYVTLNSKDQ
jgi:20S proteasome alpha/beta subunit